MQRNWIVIGLLGFAGFLIWRQFRQGDDLEAHMREQDRLRNVDQKVTALDTAALGTYPLTTIGDTPLAGVYYDPFNLANPASQPKSLRWYPGLIEF